MKFNHLLILTVNLLFCLNLSYGYLKCEDFLKTQHEYRFFSKVIHGNYSYKITIFVDNSEDNNLKTTRSKIKFSDFVYIPSGLKLDIPSFEYLIGLFCSEAQEGSPILGFFIYGSNDPFLKEKDNIIDLPSRISHHKVDGKDIGEAQLVRRSLSHYMLNEIDHRIYMEASKQ